MTLCKSWTALFAFISYSPWVAEGVSITPCPLVIMEKTNTVLSCTGIATTDQVAWGLIKGSAVTSVGECPFPNSCTSTYPIAMEVSRPSGGVSTMTIKSPTRAVYAGARISCETMSPSRAQTGGDSCEVDVIYPADVTSCTITHVRSDTTWTVSGSCTISKAFSSKGDYLCQLRQQKQGTSGDIPTGGKTPYTPTLSADYASGTCSYSATLPVDSDTYTYTVLVSPGDTIKAAGSITVAAPSAGPTINCGRSSGHYIPDNTAFDCTCSASDLGQPQGRLVGYHDNTLLVQGQYGASSLTLPTVTASRQKGQVTVRCVVDWATSDTQDKSHTFTAPVAYGPDTLTLNDPGMFDLHPASPGTMTLTCTASAANPGVTYSWSRLCDGVTSGSTCRFTPTVSDHNTSITCTVTNTAAQVTRTASRTITLNYPPNTAPTINNNNNDIHHAGNNLTLVCTVTGGKPFVSRVIFSCEGKQDGSDVSAQDGVSSSVAFTPLVAGDHGINCTCSAEWKISSWYTMTATSRLTVYYRPTSVEMTLNSRSGPLVVNESQKQDVEFVCRANGRPTPNLQLVADSGREVAMVTGGTVGDTETVLRHTLPAVRGEDSANYSCLATNDLGQKSSDSVVLYVRCKWCGVRLVGFVCLLSILLMSSSSSSSASFRLRETMV